MQTLGRGFAAVASVLLLSGCSLGLDTGTSTRGSILYTADSGQTFESRSTYRATVDAKGKAVPAAVVNTSVLSLRFGGDGKLFAGATSGFLYSSDDGKSWLPVTTVEGAGPVRAVALGRDGRVFAATTLNGLAQVYTAVEATKWTMSYQEPGTGTAITTLREHPNNPDVIYLGTNAGTIVRSTDSGRTWDNLQKVNGAVLRFFFAPDNADRVTALVQGVGIVQSLDGGKTWKERRFDSTLDDGKAPDPRDIPGEILSVADVPGSNAYLAGARNGLFRTVDGGQTWRALDIIESARKYPIYAVAVNPRNTEEIVFVAGVTLYRSTNGGRDWSTTNVNLGLPVGGVYYHPDHAGEFFVTLQAK
jgi:photosystem II stability/assembly factor-like uncharacterized protein